MKKDIRIHFVDFWEEFDDANEPIPVTHLLSEKYNIIRDRTNPDYLFFSVFGKEHLNYSNCIKIFFSGENIVADFNLCDYAMAFDHISFGDRYLRYPLYLLHHYPGIIKKSSEEALNRKFCNFVYSNNFAANPIREEFFYTLSKYKHVDSGGGFLNNIGEKVKDKMEFISGYKFTIAFENSSVPGYTTEKLFQPLLVGSIPIYWGNPLVDLDFNPKAFVNANNFDSLDALVDEVRRLDNDDQAYLDMLNAPIWSKGDNYCADMDHEFIDFLTNIFEQPIDKARRRPLGGWHSVYYLPPQPPHKPHLKWYKNPIKYIIVKLRKRGLIK